MSTIPMPPEHDLQPRIVRTLAAVQIFGGVGVAAGAAVGALLAAELASDAWAGVSAAATVTGAAVIAIPVSRVMEQHGRRPGLVLAYAIGMIGALLVVLGAVTRSFPLALLGLLASGGGMTATLQSRYAATDLATPERRGRSLSTVVWATTIGSVAGPNLASPMGRLAERIDVNHLAGPYLLSIAVYLVAGGLIFVLLRPDPLHVARALGHQRAGTVPTGAPPVPSMRRSFEGIRAVPTAVLALTAMATGQAVMVGVMSMTPLHLQHGGASITIIGVVISGHIAGMYAASPVFGIASDRFGRIPVILLGCGLLLLSFVVSGTASGHESTQLAVGLALLGLGWSCTLIAGSTLLTESFSIEARAGVQGTADLVTGLCGATAGLLSGVVVGLGSFGLLNVICVVLVLPLLIAAGASIRRVTTGPAQTAF